MGTTTATYDAAHQFLTLHNQRIQHDANGNLLQDRQGTYSYDSLDRLITVTSPISTTRFS